jgi:glutamate-1-semialdehyde aminotransferase
MRVPLMPLALSLAVGGLLYAAYQGNKRILDVAAPRQGIASPTSLQEAPLSQASNVASSHEGNNAVDLLQLDERCSAIAEVAAASIDAFESDVPFEEFLRRPVVAFVSDPSLRSELELVARHRYDQPRESPSTAQRDALREARCL